MGPDWARWNERAAVQPWSVGIEEEVMLLDADDYSLAYRIEEVLPALSPPLGEQVSPETHGSALEIKTAVHERVGGAVAELRDARASLEEELAPMGMRVAAAGLHPLAMWSDSRVSGSERYQGLYGSMRELARREPTFALHVHVGIPDGETAIAVMARISTHLPMLLALSANSPFWQGRDSGLASARTPLFQAFPRVGIPRAFSDYAEYVEAVDLLVRCEAIGDPSYLWWDTRLQPALGTLEMRIMDAQSTIEDTSALLALAQALVRAEADAPPERDGRRHTPEVLIENRFLAARDGMEARLIDPIAGRRRPARELLEETLEFCAAAAESLGCATELAAVRQLSVATGADRQRALARRGDKLPGLVAALAAMF